MKHIKLFESFKDIKSICKKYGIKNYTINSDGSVDVDGHVNLSNYGFAKLPLKFGRVSGVFDCGLNKLTTLEGSPRKVGGTLDCSYNKLTTLEGAPEMVDRHFNCENNYLTTLEGAPREVGGVFSCKNNQLTTLEGAPERVGESFLCRSNPVFNIYELFKNHKDFMDSLDWDYIRGNKIVKSRFIDACEEAGIEVPKYIKGYEYI